MDKTSRYCCFSYPVSVRVSNLWKTKKQAAVYLNDVRSKCHLVCRLNDCKICLSFFSTVPKLAFKLGLSVFYSRTWTLSLHLAAIVATLQNKSASAKRNHTYSQPHRPPPCLFAVWEGVKPTTFYAIAIWNTRATTATQQWEVKEKAGN